MRDLIKKAVEIKISTRKSALALAQTKQVQGLVEQKGFITKIIPVVTEGDVVQDRPLHDFGGKGLFIKSLEKSLLEKTSDIAVHSLKDMPVDILEDFSLNIFLPREHSGDLLLLRKETAENFLFLNKNLFKKEDIKKIAALNFATGSLRRSSLLKEVAPNINIQPLRGNIDTRVSKLLAGDFDVLILAQAGIKRLNLFHKNLVKIPLDPLWFTPSPGQGAIAIEHLRNYSFQNHLFFLNCDKTKRQVLVERLILKALGGSCFLPIGIHVKIESSDLVCYVTVLSLQGASVRLCCSFPITLSNNKIIDEVIKKLVDNGVNDILKDLSLPSIDA
ncbi:MAG: hydroxymethylbilane synthase [Zetaproteobacteria bacterium]|nr:hydroxymethylbilane synthase [Pseudobdellovibrionaceae bacterium]|tara:strand:- start:401 stop:1396 length:996 start_codon:yes stop_codon:yes gene_type:complete